MEAGWSYARTSALTGPRRVEGQSGNARACCWPGSRPVPARRAPEVSTGRPFPSCARRVPLPAAFCPAAHFSPPCDGSFCLQLTAPPFRVQPPIMTDRKAVIKNADMSEDMQQDAIDCATQALEKYNIEKDIAAFIKKEFDKKYNPTWHCIVGRNF
eukprot:scaffold137285_cov72-Phaeocystis_antarctica.AAC.2